MTLIEFVGIRSMCSGLIRGAWETWNPTNRRQDKSTHRAALSVGRVCWGFRLFAHGAPGGRTVRCSLKPLQGLRFSHGAEADHGA